MQLKTEPSTSNYATIGKLLKATEDTKHKSLTSKDWELLELLARGYTGDSMALQLHLVPKTIQDRTNRIYAKLGFSHSIDRNPRILATLWYWGITTESISVGARVNGN